jgi:hypothetical protein
VLLVGFDPWVRSKTDASSTKRDCANREKLQKSFNSSSGASGENIEAEKQKHGFAYISVNKDN